MLRIRLYFGMLPVVVLLALACIYSIYHHATSGRRLDLLQAHYYEKISDLEALLYTTAQYERSLLLWDNEVGFGLERAEADFRGRLLDWTNAEDVTGKEIEMALQELVSIGDRLIIERGDEDELKFSETIFELESLVDRERLRLRNELLVEQGHFRERGRKHFIVMVGAILLSILLLGWLAYRLSIKILGPVDALADWAERWDEVGGKGVYSPVGKDEIRRLEEAFVDMEKRIRAYQRIVSREMMRTRQRMQECFRNLPYPVMFFNPKSEVAYSNPAADRLIASENWRKELLPKLRPRVETVLGTGEEVFSREFEHVSSVKVNDEIVHYLPLFVRVDGEETEDIECGLILQDVTQLRLSDELKSDLVATVSHEIKTPVTGATMALHLVLEKSLGEINADQEDMLRTAVSDLNRLKRLLDHLLEIARLERSDPVLHFVSDSPIRIVDSLIEAYRLQAEGRGIRLVSHIEDPELEVKVDPKSIEVALSNYVTNALKHSPEGSTIEIYCERRLGKKVVFGVRDEGAGVPESEHELVFDKFYRSAKSRGLEGIGLGLSIVKEIAIAHGGSAGCSSREPAGSDFYIELDVAGTEA